MEVLKIEDSNPGGVKDLDNRNYREMFSVQE